MLQHPEQCKGADLRNDQYGMTIVILPIKDVANTFGHGYLAKRLKQQSIDPIQTRKVVAVLIRNGSPSMASVDAKEPTKVVMRYLRIKLIKADSIPTSHQKQSNQCNSIRNRTVMSAQRTVTTPRVNNTVR